MSLFMEWLDRQIQESLMRLRRKKERGEVWVSDLTSCRYKCELEVAMPHVSAVDGLRGSLVLGKLAHLGLGQVGGLNLRGEVSVEMDLNGAVLRGRVDAVVAYEDGDGVRRVEVWELKTGRDVKDIAGSSHHVVQVWVYKLLLEALKRGEARFGEDVYESDREKVGEWLGSVESVEPVLIYVTAGRVLVVPVTRKRVEAAVRELYGFPADISVEGILRAWQGSRVPLMGWECGYCPFRGLCPYADGQGQQRLA